MKILEIYVVIGKNKDETIEMDENINNELKDIKEIKNLSVDNLYQICGISKAMPISFDKITKTFKINILGTDFTYISQMSEIKKLIKGKGKILGMVDISDGYANIYYNNNPEVDIPKQRFTIAHELAHCINHCDSLYETGRFEFLNDHDDLESAEENSEEYRLHEYVCDKFARDFLIPTALLKNIYNKLRKPKISELADLFMVPEEQMRIKLDELGLQK